VTASHRIRVGATALTLAAVAAVNAGCAGRINDRVWQPFANWSYATAIGTAIHESGWLFAVIESFHLVGLAVLGGAVFIVDFRLIGIGLRDESAADLARSVQPVLLGSLAVTVVSGVLLFLSEATKFYSPDFWDGAEFPFIYKMLFLLLASVFTATVRRWMLASGLGDRAPLRRRAVGVVSLCLWTAVAVGGRAIGFY
jgi:hypothetical protein